MRALALALLVALGGCLGSDPGTLPGYRDAGAPISSIALFDPARAAGNWSEVARFANAPAAPCQLCRLSLTPESAGLRLDPAGVSLAATGPGRLTPQGPVPQLGRAEWWVLWVDTDYRTLVLGTPDGSFGLVLNRTGAIAPDRLQAAREILDWAGYDLRRLQARGG